MDATCAHSLLCKAVSMAITTGKETSNRIYGKPNRGPSRAYDSEKKKSINKLNNLTIQPILYMSAVSFLTVRGLLMPLYLPRTTSYKYTINNQTTYLTNRTLTKHWIRGFEAAKEASFLGDAETQSHRMGAVIYKGSTLLAVGHNMYGKSKPGNTFVEANGKTHNKSVHAEQVAVDQIKHYEYKAKLILYIVRLNSEGKYVSSSPCDMCIDYMRQHGIKFVRFINRQGNPQELAL